MNTSLILSTMIENFNKILFVEECTNANEQAPVMDKLIKELAIEQLNLLRGSKRYIHVYETDSREGLRLQVLLQANIESLNSIEPQSLLHRMMDFNLIGYKIYPGIMHAILVNWLPKSVFRRRETIVNISTARENWCESSKSLPQAKNLINFLKMTKSTTRVYSKTSNLRIGVIVNFQSIYDIRICNTMLHEQISQRTDIIACKIIVFNEDILAGAEREFEFLKVDLGYCQGIRSTEVQKYVLISVKGCSGKYQKYEDLIEFVRFWKLVSEWAAAEGETVFMDTGVENVNECPKSSSTTQNGDTDRNFTCGLWLVSQSRENISILQDKQSVALEMLRASEKSRKIKHPPKTSSNKLLLLILFPVFAIAIVIFAVVVSLVFYYRSKYLLSRKETAGFFAGQLSAESDIESGTKSAESQPYNKEKYELSPSSFKIDESRPLGSGEFGQVFLGSIRRGDHKQNTAVKMAKLIGSKNMHGFEMALKGLMSEIKILSYAGEHDNIIGLLGARIVNLRSGEVLVFLEFCQLGSLEKYLRYFDGESQAVNVVSVNESGHAQNEPMELQSANELPVDLSDDLYKWAGQIANGLEHLATKKIVHADIATRNILLNSERCVKISDFGLSRRMYDYTGYVKKNQEPLPWRWLSPESLQRLIFNEKSDVWAFGVTLWEMYTLGDIPYPGLSWDANFANLLETGLRLQKPKYNEKDIYSVMMGCWDIEPGRRPTFADLKSMLKK